MLSIRSLKEIKRAEPSCLDKLAASCTTMCVSGATLRLNCKCKCKNFKSKILSLKARGRSGKNCFEHVQFVHLFHGQLRSDSEHTELTEKAESCKLFFVLFFWLSLINRFAVAKILLWHAYSTLPCLHPGSFTFRMKHRKSHINKPSFITELDIFP